MAEFLIRVTDKVNDDPYLDAQCTKRGDIIVIVEDGWAWTKEEQTNPHWRILKAPSISVDAASAFLAPEIPTDPKNPSRMLQRRGFKLDISLLPEQWVSWIGDDKRAQPTKQFNGTGAQLLSFKVKKQPIADPNVLG